MSERVIIIKVELEKDPMYIYTNDHDCVCGNDVPKQFSCKQLRTQYTTHNTQHTIHNTQYTTHNTQHTTHNTQHTIHNTQHTTHNTQHTTQHTIYNTQYTTQQHTVKWLRVCLDFFFFGAT